MKGSPGDLAERGANRRENSREKTKQKTQNMIISDWKTISRHTIFKESFNILGNMLICLLAEK